MSPIICVGAIYIDTILNVPHFPGEDKKLRASSKIRRRGGNCGNSLEVLEQLVEVTSCAERRTEIAQDDEHGVEEHAYEEQAEHRVKFANHLFLIAVLPRASDSPDRDFIMSSLQKTAMKETCIFRPGIAEAASSYIIRSEETGSRTIVSHNSLPEMTLEDFIKSTENVLKKTQHGWFHFEGRIPEVTHACVTFLRHDPRFQAFKISIELEKPERAALAPIVALTDAVFYSRIWAEHHGATSAHQFLLSQMDLTKPGALLTCTWGADGATAVQKVPDGEDFWENVPAWKPHGGKGTVVDSVGAGDTFIAGMLFGLTHRGEKWSLREKLGVANEVAGRKVFREGFEGVAKDFWDERELVEEPLLPKLSLLTDEGLSHRCTETVPSMSIPNSSTSSKGFPCNL